MVNPVDRMNLVEKQLTKVSYANFNSDKPTVSKEIKNISDTTLSDEELLIFNRMSDMIPTIKLNNFDYTTSAKKSKATIFNPREKYCIGEKLIVQIDMFDHLGNKKVYGGDFIKARIFTPNLNAGASGRVEDFNNGSYHVHFTLFWQGKVFISLVLYHPSEGVSALWRARNKDYGLIYFLGTFVNGSQQVKSECGFQLNFKKEVCEYRHEHDKEWFYCTKPEMFHCESLIMLQSYNRDVSYLSELEKKLFERKNIAVAIENDFENIVVSTCTATAPLQLERCKIGMQSPFPSGFVLNNEWRPVFCNIFKFTNQEQTYKCLSDKSIYIFGDSTVRQWFHYLVHSLKEFSNLNLHRTGLESLLFAVHEKRNIQLHWKKHSHPFVASTSYTVKDDTYMAEEIDRLAGGSNYIVVISLGQHFRPFPIQLFIRRVINVHKAVKRLFLRSPETKVIIKAENTREISSDAERFSDFHGYIQYLIVKDIFQDLHVAVIDALDMGIAYNINDVHPPEHVVMNQVHMFLTYIC
ncbi:NXPE family member 4-like [Pseudophryne corroboree]|uniref:NXPE family member 4-like n=1 Tax=Pseudophryne corroboree TaxID=495146 RepID=UPI0030814A54